MNNFKVGDTIKIVNMEDEPSYSGKIGKITAIEKDPWDTYLVGTWGNLHVYPSMDTIEVVEDDSVEESFWDPSQEFDDFVSFEDMNVDMSNWNQSTNEERVDKLKDIVKKFYEENKDTVDWDGFLADLEDNNFHTEYGLFSELINGTNKSLEESNSINWDNLTADEQYVADSVLSNIESYVQGKQCDPCMPDYCRDNTIDVDRLVQHFGDSAYYEVDQEDDFDCNDEKVVDFIESELSKRGIDISNVKCESIDKSLNEAEENKYFAIYSSDAENGPSEDDCDPIYMFRGTEEDAKNWIKNHYSRNIHYTYSEADKDMVDNCFNSDDAESENLNEEVASYGEQAWNLNQIISHMNNEEAYFGAWLYEWPDGTRHEDVNYYFDDKESYQDLEDLFTSIYKRHHKDGLYNASQQVEDFAHEWDKKLGLPEIKNIKDNSFNESVDSDMLAEINTTRPAKDQLSKNQKEILAKFGFLDEYDTHFSSEKKPISNDKETPEVDFRNLNMYDLGDDE